MYLSPRHCFSQLCRNPKVCNLWNTHGNITICIIGQIRRIAVTMKNIPKCRIFHKYQENYTFTSPLSVRRIFAAAKYQTIYHCNLHHARHYKKKQHWQQHILIKQSLQNNRISCVCVISSMFNSIKYNESLHVNTE